MNCRNISTDYFALESYSRDQRQHIESIYTSTIVVVSNGIKVEARIGAVQLCGARVVWPSDGS